MRTLAAFLLAALIFSVTQAADPAPLTPETLRLSVRGIGPAITPGRIGDIAINPQNRNIWYVVAASGGVWKTTNRGINFTPIFDNQSSYSIGCVTLDPKNPDIVWVGTGENQSQRSVGFGDGIYRSGDGGKTWKNMGLKDSEHIAKILIDPRNSDVMYVASQGPLWAPGGDRGLFKSTDGGTSWKAILSISENTGITDVHFDPKNPDILYAASYQRRRHVGTLVGGGPESGIHKSTDAGKTWKKLTKGLPEWDLGRIALAVSPHVPEVVYAHIQSAAKESGAFYRSDDKGDTWSKRGAVQIQTGEYYGELFCDPFKFDKVYVMDMTVRITEDGGKTFRGAPWGVHPDHHALAFDPNNPDYLLSGNDGGLYESFDNGRTWRHFTNLPTAQYYRITVDDALPFYNVYGGTQDNGTSGGPSRSVHRLGIRTSEWGVFGGGDGMGCKVEPGNPNIVYTSSQNGALVRLDRGTGVTASIRPVAGRGGDEEEEEGTEPGDEGKGEAKQDPKKGDAKGKDDPKKGDAKGKDDPKKGKVEPKGKGDAGARVRWHWDAPLIISPHSPTRLYYAGSRLYRSDNRGTNWTAISPDLTRNLDPLKTPMMGKTWGADAVNRNRFTTPLSTITTISESPLKQGLLYAGTDDGLIQVTDAVGKTWTKLEKFADVPLHSYVTDVFASHIDADTVYATFNDYQRGNFKPYVMRSTDRGKNWKSITGDLPARDGVWSVVEDAKNKNLLFAGTEFGLYVTLNGGTNWSKLNGAPTIQFRDLEVQAREGDLVAGTFGRGVFVLDDYAALRGLTAAAAAKEGILLPIRKTRAMTETGFARQHGEFSGQNPQSGMLVTFHLSEAQKTAKVVVRIADADGKQVREIGAPATAGVHRVSWDLRPTPAAGGGGGGGFGGGGGGRGGGGALVKPGKYTVTLMKVVDGKATAIGEPQVGEVVAP